MEINNAIVHVYPKVPYIAQADVHLRRGRRIVLRTVMKDADAAKAWLSRAFPGVSVKVITHW